MENNYENNKNIVESAFWTLDAKPYFQKTQEPHKEVPIFEWSGCLLWWNCKSY
jgi:hypothetical protein